MKKAKSLLLVTLVTGATFAALAPGMAQAHAHQVCHRDHPHHRVCHWVR
ncbi:HHHH-motif protein [Paraburkholderia sp. MMS20-SJTR3]|uniref:HHHH-motif protein n=1 Tax=Paraburkholderia sejongensis TaxID=2886946 RepID=A0ABS8K5P9_9BURK|nr:HHHH-motif protein [Paraburkholderia sp. MMS20-SJTR3]MCC8397487.1 HHHH-motif protein [Paraburkholderia sp. MMS20-SJTR3]